jgi:hypothetical protein
MNAIIVDISSIIQTLPERLEISEGQPLVSCETLIESRKPYRMRY